MRQEGRLKISATQRTARHGNNFQYIEASLPRAPVNGVAAHAAHHVVNAHPMWREFIRRRTHMRHGIGGTSSRTYSFVYKLQELLARNISSSQENNMHHHLNAMQSVLRQYGNRERLSYQYAFKKYLMHYQEYAKHSTQSLSGAAAALTRFSLTALTEENRLDLQDDMVATDSSVSLQGDGQITKKSLSKSYQFWLNAVQRSMKKSATAKSSPSYEEDHARALIDLGTARLRFPAAGRRNASYDRSVRNFYM